MHVSPGTEVALGTSKQVATDAPRSFLPSGGSVRVKPRKRTTLKDLALHLGLSQTTVSFVLNDAPLAKNLTEETRRRVVEAARQFNYRPSYFALNLNKSGSDSIGVIVPEHSEGFFTVVIGGVERYLMRKHFVYFTACHYYKPKLVEAYSRLLISRGVEGLLLLNTNADLETNLPVVTVAAHKERPGVTNVVVDHLAAAQDTLRYLYSLGHRRIAFMKGNRRNIETHFRWDATMQVARDLGVAPSHELAVEMRTSHWSPEVGYGPVKELLARSRNFTALVCFNDTAAIGAIRALHEAGLRVPDDISVVGFDDIVSAQFSVPSLTTVRQPLAYMGQLAASILLERVAEPGKSFPLTLQIKPELIVRESTGPARCGAGAAD